MASKRKKSKAKRKRYDFTPPDHALRRLRLEKFDKRHGLDQP